MSVARINEFQAKPGQEGALKAFLSGLVPMIRGQMGCRSCQVLQSRTEPARLVVLETWDSVEAHQASVRSIPPESIAKVMPLLAAPPKGDYFDT